MRKTLYFSHRESPDLFFRLKVNSDKRILSIEKIAYDYCKDIDFKEFLEVSGKLMGSKEDLDELYSLLEDFPEYLF